MARPINPLDFSAPMTLIDERDPRKPGDIDLRIQLVGFTVSCFLAMDDRPRTWWASKLAFSRSHLTKMAKRPNADFVRRLDAVLRDDEVSQQKLKPRLSEYFGDVIPEHVPENPQPVVEWLARSAKPFDGQRPLADWLLHSEVAIARSKMLGSRADDDVLIRNSINQLMILSSGPYGGSAVALQRCVELALLAPRSFFDLASRHLERSPVGFRLLRLLERFSHLWRLRNADPNSEDERSALVEDQLRRMLSDLSLSDSASFLDPYPGGEWAVALARERIARNDFDHPAMRWLRKSTKDVTAHDRLRLYAAFVYMRKMSRFRLERYSSDRLKPGDDYWISQTVESLKAGGSRYLEIWADLLPNMWDSRFEDVIYEAFGETHQRVVALVDVHLDKVKFKGLIESFGSVVFSILVTPDGRLRRHLIEGLVASGCVDVATKVFVDVCKNEDEHEAIREAAAFALSRMREPSGDVSDLLLSLAKSRKTGSQLRATALWAMGDTYVPTSNDRAEAFASVLEEVAVSGKEPLPRIAAAHALAIMGEHVKSNQLDFSRHSKYLAHAIPLGDPVALRINGLSRWGLELRTNIEQKERTFPDPKVLPSVG